MRFTHTLRHTAQQSTTLRHTTAGCSLLFVLRPLFVVSYLLHHHREVAVRLVPDPDPPAPLKFDPLEELALVHVALLHLKKKIKVQCEGVSSQCETFHMSQCKSFATLNVHVALLYHELVLLDAVQDVRVVGRVRDQMPHILRWSYGVRGVKGVKGSRGVRGV